MSFTTRAKRKGAAGLAAPSISPEDLLFSVGRSPDFLKFMILDRIVRIDALVGFNEEKPCISLIG